MEFHGMKIDVAQIILAVAALVTAFRGAQISKRNSDKKKGKGHE